MKHDAPRPSGGGSAGAGACSRRVLGAEVEAGCTRFGVWAPAARHVEVELVHPEARTGAGAHVAMASLGQGYFGATVPGAGAGTLYRFRLDGRHSYPDPCSRYQPEGPHGPSMVVDAHAFEWTDHAWRGARLKGQVIYELHIGAFTPEGSFDAAIRELPELKRLGITLIEVMPLAECPGRFNWGYDGTCLYAPYHVYGGPHAFRRFVDAAHALGLAVILDVVYNHLGPDGNYLRCYSPHYFTDRYPNEWGEAIDFDGQDSGPVREFFIRNACRWISEFHLDGLRLDATQCIHDASPTHVLAEMTRAVRDTARAAGRDVVLVAENEPQDVRTVLPIEQGGHGMDAVWNDDFHHSARVAMTGRHDGYFHDHRGRAQEFVSAIRHGFLFQGQYYGWQKQRRGTQAHRLPSMHFVHFIQNHDQVANTFCGDRIGTLTSPGRLRAMTALMLLGPQTPMLFMGQEFGATAPFPFFADHRPDLAEKVWAGRRRFVGQFKAYATEAAQRVIPDPASEATFLKARLDFSQRHAHAHIWALHHDLIQLRRDDPVIAMQDRDRIEGAVLAEHAFVLRWFGDGQADRLLLVNLGPDLDFRPAPEPLLAAPRGSTWHLLWSSDALGYGGPGELNPCEDTGWCLHGESTSLLMLQPLNDTPDGKDAP